MVVGVGTVELHLCGVGSLKEKRSIVRSLIHRVSNQFHLSVAEVDFLDDHQRAAIGFAVVSNDGRFANSVLDKVVDAVEGYGLAELGRISLEVIHT